MVPILLLFCPYFLIGQQLHFQNFNVQNGLPQSQVYALENGPNGTIFIGTQGGGLAMYNGQKMEAITRDEGLSSHYINAILSDSNRIYLATAQGLNIRDNGSWKVYDSLPNLSALTFYQNTLWIASDYGLFQLKNDSIIQHQLPFYDVHALTVFKGDLICGGPKGIYNFTENQWVSQKIIEISSLLVHNDRLWVGTYGSGLYWLNGKQGQYTKPKLLKEAKIITAFYQLSPNEILVGTMHHGAYWLQNNTIQLHFNAEQGLSNNHVRSFLKDKWGGLWIGTSGGGLQKYVGSHFTHMNTQNGINGDFVYSVHIDKNEQLWLGTENGFQKQTDTGWVYFDENNQFSNTKVKCFYESSDGEMWVGTDGKGLIQVAQDTAGRDSLIFYTTQNGLSSNWIRDLIYHPIERRLYIATLGGGLSIGQQTIKNNTVQYQFKKLQDEKMPQRINDLALDTKGRLWMATDNEGVLFWMAGISTVPGNEQLKSTRIRSLDYGNKRLWVGTATHGIFQVQTESEYLVINPVSWASRLTSNNIYQLHYAEDSSIWIGTEKGLDHIQFPIGDEAQITHYGYNDGFTGLETCQNAVYEQPGQGIYFGTIAGIEIYNEKEVEISNQPPILMLKDVLLFYQPISKERSQSFAYHENHFGFNFDAIFLPEPESVQYQWRLLGYESEWSPWTEQTSVNYSNLKPGTYTFEIKAISTINNQESEIIRYSFTIIPPFWQETWFQYTVIIGSIILFLLIILFIVLRVRKRNRAQLEQVQIEKDLIMLEQKALRLQMNPHFIFNVLNSIQYMIGQEDPKVARYQLAKFSKLMRKILENSRKNLISIEDEIETIKDFVQIETYASDTKIDLQIHIDPNLPEDIPLLPPLLLQPFVENAIIHGFNDSITSPRIRLSFMLESPFLICTIEDNGVGRKVAQQNQKAEHKSTALEVTQERLDKINQSEQVQSLEIIDPNVGGTKIIIRLKVDIN